MDGAGGFRETSGIANPLLDVKAVGIRFGGIVALDEVSFSVPEGSIVGLIGPNGAGKTTLFNCATRLYTPQTGDIELAGTSLLTRPAHHVVRLGLARTFQNVELLPRMTVLQNVMVGLHSRHVRSPLHWLTAGLGLPAAWSEERAMTTAARDALAFVGLTANEEQTVAGLDLRARKRVELARALASQPRLLLLDEPAGGLTGEEVEELAALIRRIHDELGATILVVEHHMKLVMAVCDRVVCLDFGRTIADGTPRQVANDPRVVEAYLGTAGSGAA